MRAEIQNAISEVLAELNLPDCDFVVEHPVDLAHGDYATNVAMVVWNKNLEEFGAGRNLRKKGDFKVQHGIESGTYLDFGKNPREFAELLKKKLKGKIKNMEKVDIAGPGFINFYLARDFFKEEITHILDASDEWGKNDSWKGKNVVVEYTDPNPFKEFHIGHLFTNTVGESLARLFMMAGADTKRVNYQGDIGLHVACAVWGLEELGFAGTRDFSPQELGKAYALGAKALKEDEDSAEAIKTINKALYERSDKELNALYDKGRAVSLKYFEEIYNIVDTAFDHYFFESEAGPKGKELVLAHPDVFPESEGARVFQGEAYGLHTSVFVNSEGLPTYEAKELALAKIKDEAFSYDHSVVATANEINEYFKVLKKAMSFVYPELAEKTEHIGHGMVRLSSGKMSSRTGDIIPALDFIHEIQKAAEEKMALSHIEYDDENLARDIAVGAIKFATLKSNIFQDTIFDTEQALSFEGDSGPYLMYTHARICSVLKKAKESGISPNTSAAPEQPYEVEQLLYRFPERVVEALEERTPHIVASYLIQLAGAYNTFYAKERIADKEDIHAPYKAAVSQAVAETLKNGLWTLGIKAPQKM